MDQNRINIINDSAFFVLIVLYIFLFEWTIFNFAAIKPLVVFLKISIPLILYILAMVADVTARRSQYFQKYLLFLLLLICWSFIPSILSDQPAECMQQWLKFLPRCLMIFAIGIYLMSRPNASILLIKILAIIGALVVLQYLLLAVAFYLHPGMKPQVYSGNGMPLYGKWGLLGGYVMLNDRSTFRVLSYWVEPSKASGFLFPMYFLSHAVYLYTQRKKWQVISFICLLGGFLCLSNAGYLGFSGAILYGMLRLPNFKFAQLVKLLLVILLILFALFGRFYVTKYHINSEFLKITTGAHVLPSNVSYDDVSDGRVQLLAASLKTFLAHPAGIGMRTPGTDKAGNGFVVSASAPIYWLIFAGLPGLILILLSQLQVIYANLSAATSKVQLRIMQAWIAAALQQCVYGDWMNPFFLLLAVLVFMSMYQQVTFAKIHRYY